MVKGYAGVSMSEVQSKVGGSKSTLYRHFADKTDLFRAAVEMMIEERGRSLLDFRPRGETAATTLIEFGRHFADIFLDPDTIAVHRLVVSEAERVPGLGQTFLDHGPTRSIAALAAHLRNLHDAHVLTVPDPPLAASQLYQAMLGSPEADAGRDRGRHRGRRRHVPQRLATARLALRSRSPES
jgi:TetR/AcrR family transcriptional repressor of mexJK operon